MHIGYWMILVCMCLVGCVVGMIVYEHYRPQSEKQRVCDEIDRIAAQQGLRVQYVRLKDSDDDEKHE